MRAGPRLDRQVVCAPGSCLTATRRAAIGAWFRLRPGRPQFGTGRQWISCCTSNDYLGIVRGLPPGRPAPVRRSQHKPPPGDKPD